MCRWFAYISPSEPCLLEDVLITPSHSITKQVNDHYLPLLLPHYHENDDVVSSVALEAEISLRNRLLNVDGFGVAWYTEARSEFYPGGNVPLPVLYRHAVPPTNDLNFHSICSNTSTNCLFAHIRATTAAAVTEVNNHPFVFGRHTIMHNGEISDFNLIRRDYLHHLSQVAYDHIRGSTDSEHFAALYMSHLTGNTEVRENSEDTEHPFNQQYSVDSMLTAIIEAIKTTILTQKKVLGDKQEPSSLNICVTDGEQLVAIRYRNHATEQPPSLYYSTMAGVTLNRKYPDTYDGKENKTACRDGKEHGRHVIVASEPSTYKSGEWALIEKNAALLVGKGDQVRLQKVNVEEI